MGLATPAARFESSRGATSSNDSAGQRAAAQRLSALAHLCWRSLDHTNTSPVPTPSSSLPRAQCTCLGRLHIACCARTQLSALLQVAAEQAARCAATRHVRGDLPSVAAAAVVAGCAPAPRVRGARELSSASRDAQRAVALRSYERAFSSSPRATTRSLAGNAICSAPCEQPACARGGGAYTAFQPYLPLLTLVAQASASAAAGAPVTVWIKRMDVPGARYVAVKGVDLEQTVDDFTARWVVQAKLDVDPSLVTLRLVKCGPRKPSAAEEAAAVLLDDPSLNIAEARVTGTAWLLADTVQLALLAVEREEEAERQRAERRARRGAQHYPFSTS